MWISENKNAGFLNLKTLMFIFSPYAMSQRLGERRWLAYLHDEPARQRQGKLSDGNAGFGPHNAVPISGGAKHRPSASAC
jgi:hypothetical protein